MSKNKSVQEKHKELRRERQAAEKADKKRKLIKRITIIAVSVVLVAAVVTACIIMANNKYKASNAYKSGTVVMSSENYKVDLAMYTYYFYDGYYGFVELYDEQLKELNMYPDITKDLKDQYNQESTWYDFFMSNTVNQINQNLILAEAALLGDVKITDGEKAALDEKAKAIDASKYGTGVTNADILRCLELDFIAVKYEYLTRHKDMLEGTELEEYYDEYYKHFSTVNFRCLELPYSDSESSTMTQSVAEDYANLLAEAKNSDEFTELLYENIKGMNPELTDDQIKQVYDASFANEYAYSEGDIVTEWLFDEKREENETFVYHNPTTESYTVYLLTKLTERDMLDTVTSRHILFTADTYGSDSAAEAKANEIKALWEKDKSEEKFTELALAYSEDRSNCYLGGLFENYTEKELQKAYPELASWAFGGAVKGDCAVIKSQAGYHLIAFIENGLPSALARTQSQVSGENFSESFLEFEETYKVESFPALDEFKNA